MHLNSVKNFHQQDTTQGMAVLHRYWKFSPVQKLPVDLSGTSRGA